MREGLDGPKYDPATLAFPFPDNLRIPILLQDRFFVLVKMIG